MKALGASAAYILVIVAVGYGWVLNIMALIALSDTTAAQLTLGVFLRILGVFFPPLGTVMGYFG